MADQSSYKLEDLWDALLSREPGQVRKAFAGLDEGERLAVRAHLQRMATQPGWHREQRISAQAALEALSTV